MITWMQRHKKYLIITIWISTIAFVGAGFVGWGQYSYGDKAGAVAKVGSVEITMGDLQKSYSRLFAQYNQMFQGNFDEEKAKMFGLRKQALKQLTNEALIVNLANSYDLRVSDTELLTNLKTQDYFFKDGVFNKEIYKEALSRNNLTMKEYEIDLRKQLLVQKVLQLLPVNTSTGEENIMNTVMSIADKIEYTVLDDSDITIDTSNESLKKFWEEKQHEFMSEVSYELDYIQHTKVIKNYEDSKIATHYEKNKTHFKDSEGKILTLEKAKEQVIEELNTKATKEGALRSYIAYKKGKLDNSTQISKTKVSLTNNPFNEEVLEKIKKLTIVAPYLKPLVINGEYFTFKLTKINPSTTKTFEEARVSILPLYITEEKRKKLDELANKSLNSFKGQKTTFITNQDSMSLTDMSLIEANDFLVQLFNSQKKRGIIRLRDGKVVLYNVLEQKMLNVSNTSEENSIIQLKSTMFNEGLIKALQNEYTTEIFIEGL